MVGGSSSLPLFLFLRWLNVHRTKKSAGHSQSADFLYIVYDTVSLSAIKPDLYQKLNLGSGILLSSPPAAVAIISSLSFIFLLSVIWVPQDQAMIFGVPRLFEILYPL